MRISFLDKKIRLNELLILLFINLALIIFISNDCFQSTTKHGLS